ncbi:MAG: sensor histidine kinase [Oligoflexus sp.]
MVWLSSPITPIYENSAKISWLVRLRWIVIILQFLALIPGVILGFVDTSNILFFIAVISSAVVFNLFSQFFKSGAESSNNWVALQLFFDIAQLGALLCLAGGWKNPFSSLVLIYVAIGGAILSRANKIRLVVFAVFLIFVIQKFFTYRLVTNYPGIDVWVNIAVEATVVISIVIMLASLSKSLMYREKMLIDLKDRHLRMDRLRAIGTLSGAFCHQMASPINSIKLRACRLARRTAGVHDELIDDIKSIRSSVDRCETVLKKLTNIHLDPEQVIFQYQDLSELIETCVNIWHKDPSFEKVTVHLDLPGPIMMQLPGVMMTQAILDLLDNAADATEHEGHIWISLHPVGNMLHLNVEDNGSGFPEHIHKLLGEPFNTSKEQGNGLGLYHASLLAQLLGGRLEVADRHPKGASITMIFAKENRFES